MTLPTSVERVESHLRTYRFQAYRRKDGLWDIDATVQDSKPYVYFDHTRGAMEPGAFIHNISVRVTFDGDFVVRDIVCALDDTPYLFCQGGGDNLPELVGANLMKGWRQRVGEVLGATSGCTHLREMLLSVRTVAFQTLSSEWENRTEPDSLHTETLTTRPAYLGGCHAMALDGPVVATHFPQFSIPREE